MEYNWADPKKNKRVDSVMMAKAEASRVKRLSTIKSTVSNQLHPAAEHKLKNMKKKKTPEQDARPSSRLHQREFDGDNNHSNNNSSSSSNTSFYNEFLPQAAKPPSIFDGFDVHAAADGLFHPASNVQAFAEHDAKYPARDKSSARSSSSRSSRDSERRLPPLSGSTDRSERLASRSDSRLPTASSTASSSASHRSLLDSRAGSRSESELHAPRRIGIVPSSADRNAMDLLSELDDEDDDDPYSSHRGQQDDEGDDEQPQVPSPPQTKQSLARIDRSSDNNSHHHAKKSSSTVPSLDLDLTQKFEQLKLLMKTNREKSTESDASSKEVSRADGELLTSEDKATSKKEARVREVKMNKSRGDDASQVNVKKSSKPKLSVVAMASEKKEASRKPLARVDGDVDSGTSGAGLKKTKTSELKTRTGVSLSDLKQEHRAALAMLQELGGPVDADPDEQDVDAQKKLKASKGSAPSKSRSTTGAVASASATKDTPDVVRPSGSADRSARLVEKLRSQVPSGREKSHHGDATSESELHGKELINAALDAARLALAGDESGRKTGDADGQSRQLDGEEDDNLWKRFAGEDQDVEEEEEEEDPSAELYDDEYFEG